MSASAASSSKSASSSSVIARQFIVSGKVQKVYFRVHTEEEANRLGLRGTVENLPDGTVKVIAVGPAVVVGALEEWLRTKGSPMSKVDGVAVSEPPMGEAEAIALFGQSDRFGIIRRPKAGGGGAAKTASSSK